MSEVITLEGMEELYKKCLEEERAPTDHELRLALDYIRRLKTRADRVFHPDDFDLNKRIRLAEWYFARLMFLRDKFPEKEGVAYGEER